ncbi:hypothetical protein DLAC_09074 [Tieghemostelium lacteum]|uniref:Uncharacterized protein n=1 Tax=Tieghemostelium lacteum TaxID=361077 RepID=A0A151Z928_TIELA|nr:hypothetical protein DLAC_09074 [Tieghemostelium lacteum]|eukprot:KYQ90451.1 hypothetical protein DLAC_09074 [Tieghemostelium lacteum]
MNPNNTEYSLHTITPLGEVLSSSAYVNAFMKESYFFLDYSFGYDPSVNTVYYSGEHSPNQFLFIIDFGKKESHRMKLSMPTYFEPFGTYDNVNNIYYLLESLENDVSNFTLYSYDLNTKSENEPLTLKGFPGTTYSFLFSTNGQIYAASYNETEPTIMYIVYIDPTSSSASVVYTFEDSIEFSIDYWFIDNYFVKMTYDVILMNFIW